MSREARDIVWLTQLCHRRWSVAVLGLFVTGRGCRLVEVYRGLVIPRESARQAVENLLLLGLLRRNSGFGHPLRPEFLPTATGERLAGIGNRLHRWVVAQELDDLAYRKWSLPTLLAVAAGEHGFTTLQNYLPNITPRALAQALKSLAAEGLLERRVSPVDFPVAPTYHLTRTGRSLAQRTTGLLG